MVNVIIYSIHGSYGLVFSELTSDDSEALGMFPSRCRVIHVPFTAGQILVRSWEMGGTPDFSYSTPKKIYIPKTWKAGKCDENIIYTTSCKHMSILSGGCYKPIFLQVSVRSNAQPCRVRQHGAGDVAAEQFLQDRRMMNCKSSKYGIWLIWFASMNYHTWWWIYNNKTLINYCISILQLLYLNITIWRCLNINEPSRIVKHTWIKREQWWFSHIQPLSNECGPVSENETPIRWKLNVRKMMINQWNRLFFPSIFRHIHMTTIRKMTFLGNKGWGEHRTEGLPLIPKRGPKRDKLSIVVSSTSHQRRGQSGLLGYLFLKHNNPWIPAVQ